DARGNGITAHCEHDWDRRGRRLGCERSRRPTDRGEYRDPALDQLVCQCRQLFVLAACPAVLDRNRPALGKAYLAEALVKGRHDEIRVGPRKAAEQAEQPDDRNVQTLRACHERPRDPDTACQRDELTAPHSITSSARSRNASGIARPSALTAVRLMTSSNFVGCCTGRSAGLVPLRILSTNSAACRNWSA